MAAKSSPERTYTQNPLNKGVMRDDALRISKKIVPVSIVRSGEGNRANSIACGMCELWLLGLDRIWGVAEFCLEVGDDALEQAG
jgi:hypothetical protein